MGSPLNRWRSRDSSLEECQTNPSPTSGGFWNRWTLSPSQALLCPRQVWKQLYEAPQNAGPLGRDVGRDRFACGCKCFPCKHGQCQSVSHLTWTVGLPRSQAQLPTTARPWDWAVLGPQRPRDLWKESYSQEGSLITSDPEGRRYPKSGGVAEVTSQVWCLQVGPET